MASLLSLDIYNKHKALYFVSEIILFILNTTEKYEFVEFLIKLKSVYYARITLPPTIPLGLKELIIAVLFGQFCQYNT